MKTLKTLLISLLLMGMAANFLNIKPLVFSQRILRVPIAYSTIQKALDASNPGDIVHVSNGTYYEYLSITKERLTLVGENVHTTIIDGNQTGTVVEILANNVTITGFTIRRSGDGNNGVYVYRSSNNTIANNIIQDCYVGIRLHDSRSSRIVENTIANNSDSGIILQVNTRYTLISGNNITSNRYVGINLFAYADNNTLDENLIMNNGYGIQLNLPRWNMVYGNIMMSNECGIRFVGDRTAYNTVCDNVIAQNKYGIDFYDNSSLHNVIYYNDIIDNKYQLYLETPTANFTENLWNNAENEGNYWSDYEGEDLDGDGIGETKTPHLGVDCYPLSNPRSPIPLFVNGQFHWVMLRSSSVVSKFYFDQASKEMVFKVIGPSGTLGYCNVTIPKSLLNPFGSQSWAVLLDGAKVNATIVENATSTFIHFTYSHSVHNVKIFLEGSSIIFYVVVVVIALASIVFVALILLRRKQRERRLQFRVLKK